jgi:hypothetical protein
MMKSGKRFRRSSALAVLALLLAAACVKFKPPDLDEPAAVLERFLFCASVEQKEDWAEPGPAKSVFTAEAEGQVFAFVGFADLRGAHTLAWKWYGPTRKLERAPEAIKIGEEGKSYESYIAWDAIAVTPDRARGAWTVAVFLDEALLAAKSFEIKE